MVVVEKLSGEGLSTRWQASLLSNKGYRYRGQGSTAIQATMNLSEMLLGYLERSQADLERALHG